MFQMQQGQTLILNEECEMYDTEFLNTSQGPAKTSKGRQTPGTKGLSKTKGTKATH